MPISQVRAKFRCESIETNEYNHNVKLRAVCGKDGENKDFADATPGGDLKIMISKGRPAAGFFEPGKDYYLDFTEA